MLESVSSNKFLLSDMTMSYQVNLRNIKSDDKRPLFKRDIQVNFETLKEHNDLLGSLWE